MSIQTHIDSLSEKRAQLKQRIAEEASRPFPDFILITNMKKQNLQLKQEMQRYLSLVAPKHAEASS